MFAPIYECSNCECKETWQFDIVQQIDTDRDDVWDEVVCRKCGNSNLTPKLDEDGKQWMHILSEEEHYWESYWNSEDDEF